MKTLLLILFATVCVGPLFAQTDDSRVSATWQVQKYDITATLPANDTDRNLVAKAKIDLKNVSSRPAGTLTLRISTAVDVTGVAVNGAANEFTKGEEKTGTGSLQRIAIRMPSVAPGGTAAVTVDYKLNVKDNSGLAAISSAGSQFLPLGFWYPTPNSWFFARGADHAPVRLQVNGATGKTIVAPGQESAGAIESKLAIQPFFLAGDWERTDAAGGIGVYLPKGNSAEAKTRGGELAAIASEASTFISGVLGTPADSQLKLVAVRRGAGFSSGGTILFEESVLRRPKVDSQTALNIAEGVAKTWLGGMVSLTGDGSGAIREGLARYLATQFIESKYGKDVADVERLRQRVAYAAVAQRDAPISTVSPLDEYY